MSSARAEVAIRAILRAGNHFDALQLPKPYPDLVDEPIWEVGPDEVHRAFRKRSIYCHPDKSRHPDAPHAFELLKRAKACLTHDLDRDAYVRSFVREQKTKWEGNWTSAAEVVSAKQRVSKMRGEAQMTQAESVIDAMQQRREKAARAARMRDRFASSRPESARAARRAEEAELLGSSEDEDEAGPSGKHAPAKVKAEATTAPARTIAKKRPKFL